mgnify:CR=1 FL=1
METFYCPQILLPEGWAENRVIEVDDEGSVSAVRQGIPADAKKVIRGMWYRGCPTCTPMPFKEPWLG